VTCRSPVHAFVKKSIKKKPATATRLGESVSIDVNWVTLVNARQMQHSVTSLHGGVVVSRMLLLLLLLDLNAVRSSYNRELKFVSRPMVTLTRRWAANKLVPHNGKLNRNNQGLT
jgi:hypothetical protein